MQVGIFLEERRPGTTEGGSLHESLELADLAEAWGLDGVWLGEIHFNPARSVHSAPIALASFIAARTRRVRVGTAVQVLPLGNPLRIAEEVATVDHLSQGRFDFGVGRSGAPRAYDVLGIPYGESQARFEEALEIILKAWQGQPFSHHGKFFHFDKAVVAPSPYQRPHPPIRMAANSPETFALVGRLGLQLFAGLRDLGIPELKGYVASYRAAWQAAGHPGRGDVCVRIPVYAAPTEQEALEEPRENMMHFVRRHAELVRSGMGRSDTGPADRRHARFDEVANLSYDDVLQTRVAFGSAASLTERLRQIRDEVDLDGIVAELNPSGLFSMEQMQRTLRIVTHQVMPALKGP
jgi:alkanesulfonate monooxygenase SsuD/methylene tetrahydromethanopterin reductase-like flavin-dependent oxidoreductase (luciferase family)